MANPAGFISDDEMTAMEQQQQAAAPAQQDPTKQVGFISDADMREQARPQYVSGLSEQTPINESPISGWDRMRMSAGQMGGNMSGTVRELQKMGYEVKRDKDNELILRDPADKLWKRYDAKDAWSASRSIWENLKETGADIMDIAPDLATGAVQQAVAAPFEAGAAAATFLSGGAATPAAIATVVAGQAAGSVAATAAKTIMGKLAGTAPSNPDEDFADLSRETLMNLGGGIIGVGVRPTAAVIGRNLRKLGDVMPSFDEATKASLRTVFGTTTGAGADRVGYILNEGGADAVGTNLARFKGMSAEAIKDSLKKEQVDILADTAPKAFKVLRGVGAQEEANVLNAVKNYVGETVEIEGKHLTHSGIASLEPILDFTVKREGQAPLVLKSFKDAMEYGLGNVDIAVKNKESLIGSWGRDLSRGARSSVDDLVETLRGYSPVKASGVEGASWAMKANRGIKSSIDSFDDKLMAEGITELKPLTRAMKENLEGGLRSELDKMSSGAYTNFLNTYKQAATVLEPYTSAAMNSRASNNRMAAFETLVNKMNSRAGSNVYAKGAGDELTQLAAKYAPGMASEIQQSLSKAELHSVTSGFADWTRSGLIGQAATSTGLTGAMLMNPGLVAGAATSLAMSSPRLALKATPAMLRAAQQVKALTAGGGKRLAKLAQTDPRILQQLVEAPFRLQQHDESVKQQVASTVQQAATMPLIQQPQIKSQQDRQMKMEQMMQKLQQGGAR